MTKLYYIDPFKVGYMLTHYEDFAVLMGEDGTRDRYTHGMGI